MAKYFCWDFENEDPKLDDAGHAVEAFDEELAAVEYFENYLSDAETHEATVAVHDPATGIITHWHIEPVQYYIANQIDT